MGIRCMFLEVAPPEPIGEDFVRISFLKHLLIASALVTVLAVPAAAQQPSRPVSGGNEQTMLVGLGVTFMNVSESTGIGVGGNALFNALTTSDTGRIGIVGDFGFNDFDGGSITTFMGGPRYTFNTTGKLVPYGQFLLGLGHGGGDTDFVTSLAFGTDIAWKENMNFRAEIAFIFGDGPDPARFFFGVSLPFNK